MHSSGHDNTPLELKTVLGHHTISAPMDKRTDGGYNEEIPAAQPGIVRTIATDVYFDENESPPPPKDRPLRTRDMV